MHSRGRSRRPTTIATHFLDDARWCVQKNDPSNKLPTIPPFAGYPVSTCSIQATDPTWKTNYRHKDLCAVFDGMVDRLVGTCGKTCTPTSQAALPRCYNAFATDRCWNFLTRLSTTLIRKTSVGQKAVLLVRYHQRSIIPIVS
jgi:hypothetical protein